MPAIKGILLSITTELVIRAIGKALHSRGHSNQIDLPELQDSIVLVARIEQLPIVVPRRTFLQLVVQLVD